MTQDKRLTEQQRRFAELLVYNEGRMSPSECAYEAGYKTRPRQAASEMRNAKYFPLVVQFDPLYSSAPLSQTHRDLRHDPTKRHRHDYLTLQKNDTLFQAQN